jgi:hypothetical protein
VSTCCSLPESDLRGSDSSDMPIPKRPGPMLARAHLRFNGKGRLRVRDATEIALFKTEQFCLFSVVVPPNLRIIVQDHIQQ